MVSTSWSSGICGTLGGKIFLSEVRYHALHQIFELRRGVEKVSFAFHGVAKLGVRQDPLDVGDVGGDEVDGGNLIGLRDK